MVRKVLLKETKDTLKEIASEELFHCDICTEEMNIKNVYTEEHEDFEHYYTQCPNKDCQTKQTIYLDNYKKRAIVKDIKTAKRLIAMLQLEYELEDTKLLDEINKKKYQELTEEERELVGDMLLGYTEELEDVINKNKKLVRPSRKEIASLTMRGLL